MTTTEERLALRLEAKLNAFENQMKFAKNAGRVTADEIAKRFNVANAEITKSAERSARSIARQVDGLRSKYDPAYVATKRLKAAQAQLKAAYQAGAISAEEQARLMDRIQAEYDQTTAAAKRMGTAVQEAGRRGMRGGAGLQNVGYQVQDFAVQVGAGTSASVALGQQLPQLLSGFGLLGVAMGTAAAVGVPLVKVLMDTEEEAETAEDAVSSLNSALSDMSGAIDAARDLDALIDKYGQAAQAARDLFIEQSALAQQDALSSARSAASSLSDEIGAVHSIQSADDLERARQFAGQASGPGPGGQARQMLDEFEALRQSLDLTEQQALDLNTALLQLSEAQTVDELTSGAAAFRTVLQESGINIATLSDEMRGFIGNIYDAELSMLSLAKAQQELEASNEKSAQNAANLALQLSQAVAEGGATADTVAHVADALGIGEVAASHLVDRLIDGSLSAQDLERALADGVVTSDELAMLLGQSEASANAIAGSGIGATIDGAANAAYRMAGGLAAAMAQLRGIVATAQSDLRNSQRTLSNLQRYGSGTAEFEGAQARGRFQEQSGMTAYDAIRTGNTGALSEIAAAEDRVASAAAETARLESAAQQILSSQSASASRSSSRSGPSSRSGSRTTVSDAQRAAREQARAVERIQQNMERSVQRAQDQLADLGQSAATVARNRAEREMLRAAQQANLDLDKKYGDSQQTLRDEIRATADQLGQLAQRHELATLTQRHFDGAIDSLAGGLASVATQGQSLRAVLADVWDGIAHDLAKSGIQLALRHAFRLDHSAAAGGVLGGLGGALASGLGAVFGGSPSYEGGGHTGYGPRMGGVDGRGGFPAILHPNEQVIDLTKGQRLPGLDINLNVTTTEDLLASAETRGAQGAVKVEQRKISRRSRIE